MLVHEVMSRPVVTVEPGTPVRAAAALLTGRGFTALPVVDDGLLVGIVTEADLVRDRLLHDIRSPKLTSELDRATPPQTVGEVMTTDVVTTTRATDVADLVAVMLDRRVRSVPVVDECATVLGIVSRRDVLSLLTRADQAVASAVRHRLETYSRPGRWDVSVHGGLVTIGDEHDDPAERHVAQTLASSVPGVLGVQVVSRQA